MADTLFRLRCPECGKHVTVEEAEVDEQTLSCPFCEADLDLDGEEEDEADEEDNDTAL